jgi:hypothetical protein
MKCLLYCTIALPWLYQGADGKWYVTKSKCAQVGCKPARNGYVSFECDCKEAFKYDFVHRSGDSSNFYIRDQRTERMKDCLSNDDLFDYGKGKTLYAYHFENVKPIYPMPITQLYRDGTMVYPLTRAPQSYCFAYRKVETTKEDYLANVGKDESRYYLQENGKFFYSEKVLVFSIRSPWLCKIANGEKDLEVRKQRILNAGIEETK